MPFLENFTYLPEQFLTIRKVVQYQWAAWAVVEKCRSSSREVLILQTNGDFRCRPGIRLFSIHVYISIKRTACSFSQKC